VTGFDEVNVEVLVLVGEKDSVGVEVGCGIVDTPIPTTTDEPLVNIDEPDDIKVNPLGLFTPSTMNVLLLLSALKTVEPLILFTPKSK
jgi:hypothetical protein